MKLETLCNKDRFINLVWVLFGIVLWMIYMPMSSALEGGLLAASLIAYAFPFTTYLSRNLLRKAIRNRKMLLFTGQFFLITAIAAVFMPFILYGFLYLEEAGIFPPSGLILQEDSFLPDYLNTFLVTLLVNFGFCGLRFYQINLRLQKELAESKLDTLQKQITPHFMFNVLNHIHVLMQTDTDRASDLLLRYSEILRYQLYSAKTELVPLDQEIAFLTNFITVERMRWEDYLDVNCSWNIENERASVAPLLFITLIENAFKHTPRDESEKGMVDVRLHQQGNRVCLDVRNSKPVETVTKKISSGLGLTNTKKRLELLYPGRYELSVKETETTYHSTLTLKI